MKISAIQIKPKLESYEFNKSLILKNLDIVHKSGSKLNVFPELATSGYSIQDKQKLSTLKINLSEDLFIKNLCVESRKYESVIVIGIPEQDGERIFNSALVIDMGKILGTYRKVNLWDRENDLFSSGDLGFPIFNTHLGKLGVMICYDLWRVDVDQTYQNRHVDFMAIPTNWIASSHTGPTHQSKTNPVGLHIAQENARKQKCIYICSDRVGIELPAKFIGNSGIINKEGNIIKGPASPINEEILLADI